MSIAALHLEPLVISAIRIYTVYLSVSLCFLPCPDYSELPPSVNSNGPQDHDCDDEEENGYDFPKPPLPIARRTLSEASSSSAAFSRLSVDSEPGTSSKYTQTDLSRQFNARFVA